MNVTSTLGSLDPSLIRLGFLRKNTLFHLSFLTQVNDPEPH